MTECTREQALAFRTELQANPKAACLLKCPDRTALAWALYHEIDRLNNDVTSLEAELDEADDCIASYVSSFGLTPKTLPPRQGNKEGETTE